MAKAAYGYRHQQARKRWDARLATHGPIPCRRCGELVHCDAQAYLNSDGRPFQLGHGVAVVNGGDGSDAQPECTACNERAGSALAKARAKCPASRDW